MKIDIFVIDFDSTFVMEESFSTMVNIAVNKNHKKRDILTKLKEVRDLCMNSQLDFKDNFKMKMEFLYGILKEEHLVKTGKILEKKVSPAIEKIINFARKKNKKIIVLSNSFKTCMKDTMNKYGIEIYFANKHFIDKDGFVNGYDEANIMANNDGKENIIKFLKNVKLITPDEKIIMIGDGMNDYKVYKNGYSDYFMNFAINENRKLKKYRKENEENFIIARKEEDVLEFLKKVE